MSRFIPCSADHPPVDARGRSKRLWLYVDIPARGKPVAGHYTHFGDDFVGIEGADEDGEYLTEDGEVVAPTHWAIALPGEDQPPAFERD